MKVTCISASNIIGKGAENGTSYEICRIILDEISKSIQEVCGKIIELKNLTVQPCIGCGKCFQSHRCFFDDDFNDIYREIISSEVVFFVSPHYAPIPSKLSALLERMEQITFLHWGKDNSYQSEVYGKRTGVISHGGGEAWALDSYKKMVNDTIANALDTIQMKLIPLNDEWDTGLSIPVEKATFQNGDIFPIQEYDWDFVTSRVKEYTDKLISTYLEENQ